MAGIDSPPKVRFAEWVEQAVDHDFALWLNEEARYSKALYVGGHTEADRRRLHSEARMAIKSARAFWASIPAEYREAVAREAGLSLDAIPASQRFTG
jgi:hypothetical protein